MSIHVVYKARVDPLSSDPGDWVFTLLPREADPKCALELLAVWPELGPKCRARADVWRRDGLRSPATCTLPAEHFGDHVDGTRGKVYARWRE